MAQKTNYKSMRRYTPRGQHSTNSPGGFYTSFDYRSNFMKNVSATSRTNIYKLFQKN